MRVVPATLGDIYNWLQLAAEVEHLFGAMLFDPGFLNALYKHIERGTAFCVREDDGPPGAEIMGGLMWSPMPPDKYEIAWLAVAENFRRRGVADALIEHVFGLVQPPAEVVLITFAEGVEGGEAARRLYMKHGFRAAEPGPLNPGGLATQVFRREFAHPPTVRAVVQHADHFLFVQHHYKNPANLGKWSMPGGRIGPRDADWEATLRRELCEEFRLEVDIWRFLDTYTHNEQLHHVYHVQPRHLYLVTAADEIAAVGWFTLPELEALHASDRLFAPFMLDAVRFTQTPSVRAVIQYGDRYLLVEHDGKLADQAGKWTLPGGRVHPDDADHVATLRRELGEEFQIRVDVVRLINTYTYRGRQQHVYLVQPRRVDVVTDPAETLSHAWLTFEEITAWDLAGRLLLGCELAAITASRGSPAHPPAVFRRRRREPDES